MDEQEQRIYFSDKCYLDCRNRELYYEGKRLPVRIRPLDYKIICAMSANPGLFTYDGLIKACWSVDAQTRGVSNNTVSHHICDIRKWHTDVAALIIDSTGVGYKYIGPKCGDTPSATEKKASKQSVKVSKTASAILLGASSPIPEPNTQSRQSTACYVILGQIEEQILHQQQPTLLLLALRGVVEELTQYSQLMTVVARLESFRDKYGETDGLSGESLLRLEAVLLAAQRKMLEQEIAWAQERLEEHRNQQNRAAEKETIEEIAQLNARMQAIDSDAAQVRGELDKSNSYTIY